MKIKGLRLLAVAPFCLLGDFVPLLSRFFKILHAPRTQGFTLAAGQSRLRDAWRFYTFGSLKIAETPKRSEGVSIPQMEGQHLSCESAGVFLFAPFLEDFDITELVRAAGLPGNKVIPAVGYFLSFLALKLIRTERYGHMGDHAFDRGLGLSAG
ncbi:MAG: hypothetical protein QM278_02700 [Pseudomonadota bacterium]|nr:hypothetical protein [Pseudomonadota bacterium]